MDRGLYGMISGNPVADVLTTGSATIPAMKKFGFPGVKAAGIVAAASAGGPIMPPVMGAAAFIMAQLLNIQYREIVTAAFVPGLLYYVAMYAQVHFFAQKMEMGTGKPDEGVRLGPLLIHNIGTIASLITLVFMILQGFSPQMSATFAIIVAIVGSWLNPGARVGLRVFISLVSETSTRAIVVTNACTASGLVIGGLLFTGLAGKFTSILFQFTGNSSFLTLLMTFVVVTILGMGMPVSAAYILTAILAVPALTHVGFDKFAAHLFVVYASAMSAITPPVALAAFAAAGLADEEPVPVGLQAVRFGIVAYILPFAFAYNQAILLRGSLEIIVISIAACLLASLAMAAAFEGFLRAPLSWPKRLILGISGLALLAPNPIAASMGAVATIVMWFWQGRNRMLSANEELPVRNKL